MDQSGPIILDAAFVLYILLLCVAAAFDAWKFIIPNAITLALVVLFVVTALLLPFEMTWTDWLYHVGAGVVVFLGGIIFYAFNWMGGGDVKLLTAVALWMGFERLTSLLLYVALAGAALAIGLLVLRRIILSLRGASPGLRKIKWPRVLLEGEGVPYGLAIAPISVYLGAELPQLGAIL